MDDVVEALGINGKCKVTSLLRKKDKRKMRNFSFLRGRIGGNLFFVFLGFFFLHGVILKVVSLCKAEKREGSQIPC